MNRQSYRNISCSSRTFGWSRHFRHHDQNPVFTQLIPQHNRTASTQVKEEKFGKLAAAVASLTWPPQSLSTIVMVGAKAPPSGALHCQLEFHQQGSSLESLQNHEEHLLKKVQRRQRFFSFIDNKIGLKSERGNPYFNGLFVDEHKPLLARGRFSGLWQIESVIWWSLIRFSIHFLGEEDDFDPDLRLESERSNLKKVRSNFTREKKVICQELCVTSQKLEGMEEDEKTFTTTLLC